LEYVEIGKEKEKVEKVEKMMNNPVGPDPAFFRG